MFHDAILFKKRGMERVTEGCRRTTAGGERSAPSEPGMCHPNLEGVPENHDLHGCCRFGTASFPSGRLFALRAPWMNFIHAGTGALKSPRLH